MIAGYFPLSTDPEHSAREQAVIYLFSRVIDLENFSVVLQLIPEDRRHLLYRKLGWFNVLNPIAIDQHFDLDLSFPDEKRFAELLTALAIVEPVRMTLFLQEVAASILSESLVC